MVTDWCPASAPAIRMAVLTFFSYRWRSDDRHDFDHHRYCGCGTAKLTVRKSHCDTLLDTSNSYVPRRVTMANHPTSTARSTAFFYRFCTDLIAELFLPPVTGSLMRRNIWIPLIGAVGFQGLSSLLTLALPETLPRQDGMASDHNSNTDVSSDPDEEFPTKNSWKTSMRETLATFDFATRDAVIASLVLTFLISKVGRQSSNILFQYVSKRYGWELSQVRAIYITHLIYLAHGPSLTII